MEFVVSAIEEDIYPYAYPRDIHTWFNLTYSNYLVMAAFEPDKYRRDY